MITACWGTTRGIAAEALWKISCIVVAVSVCGCSSTGYKASELPEEFRVPPRENPQTVDLSRLAGSSSSNNLISKGDVLDVTISAGLSNQDTVTFPVRVNEKGTANLPIIGTLELTGLELEGAEAAITSACIHGGLYKSPHVTVTMKRRRMNRITVMGAVDKPSVYELPREGCDLLAALVAAGGLAEDAGANVEIRRPRSLEGGSNSPSIAGGSGEDLLQAGHSSTTVPTVSGRWNSVEINLASAAKEGSGGYQLPDGSVVMVEKRDPVPITVVGLVTKPGPYDYPYGKDIRLLDAISMAEGLTSPVANKIYVIRKVPHRPNPVVIKVSYRKAKWDVKENLRLAPGDIVSVEQTPATVLIDTIKVLNFGVGASLGTIF